MPLKVIGAGLGRTGTTSLKVALEQLGLGRCYHMLEVFPNPAAPALWLKAMEGKLGDWEEIFADYGATTDWPGCTFWRELIARYPDAKVILTERDPDAWFDSTQRTIFSDEMNQQMPDSDLKRMMDGLVFDTFGGRIHDRGHCIEVFRRHNAEVRAEVPREKLLLYDIAEGWGPLCSFLGLPVPDAPFPRANTTEDFHSRRPERLARIQETQA